MECEECADRNADIDERRGVHTNQAEKYRRKAVQLAKARILRPFIDRYIGKPKKAVWQELFENLDYPSLGTFYQHTRLESLEGYLERVLLNDLDAFIPRIVRDPEIEELQQKAKEEDRLAQLIDA